MTSLARTRKNLLRLSGIASIFSAAAFASGIAATASYTSVADPNTAGVYDYTFTLNNTGITTIGTFWFSWVPGAGFLSSVPTNVSSPASWNEKQTNSGKAIQWTTTSLLQSGQSLGGFSFDSTETPDQLLGTFAGPGTGAGEAVTTSYVYIAAPLGDPGALIVPTAAAPEPESFVLLATGLAGGVGVGYRRFKGSQAV